MIKFCDLSEPYKENGKWHIDESLCTESRGFIQHSFETQSEAFIWRDKIREETALQKRKFTLGDRLKKIKGSSWQGKVVGFYSTSLTPIAYPIESEREPGSVQIYPEAALEKVND